MRNHKPPCPCGYVRWVAGDHLPGCILIDRHVALAPLRFGPTPTKVKAHQEISDARGREHRVGGDDG